MTAYQQVVAAWNAQADEHNQWDALGEDEKIEWALKCADQFRGATKMMQTAQQALDWAGSHGEAVFMGGGMPAIDGMNAWTKALREAMTA